MKLMRVETITGEIFPGIVVGETLCDSRTGKPVEKADKWTEITEDEFNWLCDSWGIEE